MTILQKPRPSGNRHTAKAWYGFGHHDQAVRYTEAWEHETFAEEQARWERSDPDYARICEAVRQARHTGGEASRRAVEAKAEWDVRVARERQANDDAQRAQHALIADRTTRRRPCDRADFVPATEQPSPKDTRTPHVVIGAREAHHDMHTTFAVESNDSPAPGIIPGPVHIHDQPAGRHAAPDAHRQAAQPNRWPRPGQGNPVSIVLAKLMGVIRSDTYMVDAYPSASGSDSAPGDGDGLIRPSHDAPLRASARSPAPPEPGEATRDGARVTSDER